MRITRQDTILEAQKDEEKHLESSQRKEGRWLLLEEKPNIGSRATVVE